MKTNSYECDVDSTPSEIERSQAFLREDLAEAIDLFQRNNTIA